MKNVLLILLLCLLDFISGCTTLSADDPNLSSEIAQGRRSREIIISDQEIEQDFYDELADDKNLLTQTHVNAHAYNGVLLLTGEVPDPASMDKIVSIARLVDQVKLVHNKLAVAVPSDLPSRTSDRELLGHVKTALGQIRSLPGFSPTMVKVYAERGAIYLMGRVHRNEGNTVINVIRYQPHVKQIITVFDYLD